MNQDKLREAAKPQIAALGTRWCLHPANSPKIKPRVQASPSPLERVRQQAILAGRI
ncbi:MAG TPA: hypothetical protein VFM48_07715 [Aquabacterium sp.]|nr:hypothetical protein [Aquabacterium sp.]